MRCLYLLSATLAVTAGSWGNDQWGNGGGGHSRNGYSNNGPGYGGNSYGGPSYQSYNCWEKQSYGGYNNHNNGGGYNNRRWKRDSGYGPYYGPPATTLECGGGYNGFTCQLQGGSSYGPPRNSYRPGPSFGRRHGNFGGFRGGRGGGYGGPSNFGHRGGRGGYGGGRGGRWKRDSGYGGPQEIPCTAGYNTYYCTREQYGYKPSYKCVDKSSGGHGGGYGGNFGGYGNSGHGGGYGGNSGHGGYGGSGHGNGGYGGGSSGGYSHQPSSYQSFPGSQGYGPGSHGGSFGGFGHQFGGYGIGFGLKDVDKTAGKDDTNANNCKRECYLDRYNKQNCRMKCCNWQCPHVCINIQCCNQKFPINQSSGHRRKRSADDADGPTPNEKCRMDIPRNKKKCKFSCYVKMENLDQKKGKYFVSETFGNYQNTDQHSAQNAFHAYSRFYKKPDEEHPNLAKALISQGVKGPDGDPKDMDSDFLGAGYGYPIYRK